MNNIDKWCAEQCGVIYGDGYWTKGSIRIDGEDWTIQDPRCREIVRERFRILTHPFMEKDYVVTQCKISDTNKILREGKTIAEAEIACITAIYQQLKDKDKLLKAISEIKQPEPLKEKRIDGSKFVGGELKDKDK